MPDTGISIIWGGLAAAVITATAAIGSAAIARQVKISEFRQNWINALRDDIVEYMTSAEQWIDLYQQLNTMANTDEKKPLISNLDEHRYQLLRMLRRIRLRFNPHESSTKLADDAFLQALLDMIDPGKFPSISQPVEFSLSAWNDHAASTEIQARLILKREWEVTKHPVWTRLKKIVKREQSLLGLG